MRTELVRVVAFSHLFSQMTFRACVVRKSDFACLASCPILRGGLIGVGKMGPQGTHAAVNTAGTLYLGLFPRGEIYGECTSGRHTVSSFEH